MHQFISRICYFQRHDSDSFQSTFVEFKLYQTNLNYIKRISTIFLNCISKQVCELILLIHELDENHNNDGIPFHTFKWNGACRDW